MDQAIITNPATKAGRQRRNLANSWKAIAATILVNLGLAISASSAEAQMPANYPTRFIKVVVPYLPGSFPDVITRLVTNAMSKDLGQPIIIDNKPGGGGLVAVDAAVRSAPDGYTLLSGDMQQWAISPFIYKEINYNPETDLLPISIMGTTPLFLVASAKTLSSPDLKSLIEELRSHPNQYHYGSVGNGSIHHLAMEMLKSVTGIQINHVPYKGGSAMVPGMAGGEVAVGFQALNTIPRYLKEGSLKVYAVATERRSPIMPEVPTFAEAGLKDMVFPGSQGLLAIKGTSNAIIERLARSVKVAVSDPEVLKRMEALSLEPVGNTPAEFEAWIQADRKRVRTVVDFAQIKAE